MKISITICFLMTVLMSCHKQADSNQTKSIQGNWEWISTDGGLANHIHETPVNTGKQMQLIFGSDEQYTLTANGSITQQGRYSVTTKTCIHNGKPKMVIQFSGNSNSTLMVENLVGDTLLLSDEAHDGLGYTYKKN
jgi:hypothetical protein